MDRSSNRVVAAALALTLTAGVVYSGPAQGSTAVAPMPRSALGVDLGFTAHLHDATSGPILARARVLDPLTGAFLQRDPNGYQDSVNQYAYGANDPINHRDPTGRLVVSKKLAEKYPRAAKAILHAAELLTARIYRGLETYGGADKAQVDEVLKPNQGPVVEAAWEPEYPKLGLYPCGHFLPRQPNVINIAPDVLEAMNTGTIDDSALMATLFHELVHYLRNRNGMPVEDEEREAGKLFEQTVLGQYADCRTGPPDLKKWGLPVLTSPPLPPVPGTRRGPWTPPGTPPVLEPELRLTDTP